VSRGEDELLGYNRFELLGNVPEEAGGPVVKCDPLAAHHSGDLKKLGTSQKAQARTSSSSSVPISTAPSLSSSLRTLRDDYPKWPSRLDMPYGVKSPGRLHNNIWTGGAKKTCHMAPMKREDFEAILLEHLEILQKDKENSLVREIVADEAVQYREPVTGRNVPDIDGARADGHQQDGHQQDGHQQRGDYYKRVTTRRIRSW